MVCCWSENQGAVHPDKLSTSKTQNIGQLGTKKAKCDVHYSKFRFFPVPHRIGKGVVTKTQFLWKTTVCNRRRGLMGKCAWFKWWWWEIYLVGERVARGPLGGSSRRRKSLQQRQVTAIDMVETIWPKFHLCATLLTGERSGLPRNPRLSSAFEEPSFFNRKIPWSFLTWRFHTCCRWFGKYKEYLLKVTDWKK